ncbi:flagellar hook-length control protein FliK [Nitrospira defluvii]|nr:flagellar hook-length control protein FliK [Nitrospira defluvii]
MRREPRPMSPLQSFNAIEAIFSPIHKNEPFQKMGSASQALNPSSDSRSFKEVLETRESREVNKESSQVASRSQENQEKSGDVKEMSENQESADNRDNREIVENKEGSAKTEMPDRKAASEGERVIVPFQSLFNGTNPHHLQNIVIEESGGQHLKGEPPQQNPLLGKQSTRFFPEDVKEETVKSSQNEGTLKGSEDVTVKGSIKEGALSLKGFVAAGAEEDGESELQIKAEELQKEVLGEKAGKKIKTNSKQVDENASKMKGDGLIQDAELEFSGTDPELDLEKGNGENDRASNSKGQIKVISSNVSGVQEGSLSTQNVSDKHVGAADKQAIFSQVSEQIKILQPGRTEHIRFQLEPESLGSLQIELSLRKGVVVAHIITGDPLVKELLESNQALLRERLAEQGFQVDQFSVDVGEMGNFFDEKKEELPFMNHRHSHVPAAIEEAASVLTAPLMSAQGSVNLYV